MNNYTMEDIKNNDFNITNIEVVEDNKTVGYYNQRNYAIKHNICISEVYGFRIKDKQLFPNTTNNTGWIITHKNNPKTPYIDYPLLP